MNTPAVKQQRGFILVTALIMLSLLTLLSIGMYMSGRSATQTSASAQSSTEAYYYAEAGINYISWGLSNDAEFDSFTYSGTYIAPKFDEPPTPSTSASVGDRTELYGYLLYPGPTGLPGATATDSATRDTPYTAGQVMYFDNSPMSSRAICFQNALDATQPKFTNCVDVKADSTIRYHPSMYQISTKLPRYIKLDIAPDGTIVTSIPQLPHRGSISTPIPGPVVENNQNPNGTYDHNGDIPKNGAIVWLTAAAGIYTPSQPNTPNLDHDLEIFPLDPANAYGGIPPTACVSGSLPPNCPCDGNNIPADAQACDANTGLWLSNYSIVIYAIGYVNGKPRHMLRTVIQ